MIVGINGYKESGKTTVGNYLQQVYDFKQVSFAAKLKESVAALFNIPVNKVDHYKEINASIAFLGRPIDFRVFLQRYGTEAHRDIFGWNFWVEQLFTKGVHTFAHENVCITDARFENELEAIRNAGGYNVRIIRSGVKPDGHTSEVEPPKNLIDHVIYNDADIRHLEVEVDHMLGVFIKRHNSE